MRDHHVTRNRGVALRDRPNDQRRPENHQHVAFGVSPGDQLLGECIDAARGQHRVADARRRHSRQVELR